MKKHTLLTKVMAGGLVTVTLLGVAFAAGQQGTQSDPLVTLSYLKKTKQPGSRRTGTRRLPVLFCRE